MPTVPALAVVHKFHDCLRCVDRVGPAPCPFEMLGFMRVVFGGFPIDDVFCERQMTFRA